MVKVPRSQLWAKSHLYAASRIQKALHLWAVPFFFFSPKSNQLFERIIIMFTK